MNHTDCTAPAPKGAAVAMCVAHLIAGVATAFVALLGLAVFGLMG